MTYLQNQVTQSSDKAAACLVIKHLRSNILPFQLKGSVVDDVEDFRHGELSVRVDRADF